LAPTKCHHTRTAVTTPSSGVIDHQRGGRTRRVRMPSATSRRCRAISEMAVAATPRIIASILIQVGELL
jgi:hypothetical protein